VKNAWMMRGAALLCLAVIIVVGAARVPLPWSTIAFYALLMSAGVLFALSSPPAVHERARRRAVRADILRELEIRDGVRQPD